MVGPLADYRQMRVRILHGGLHGDIGVAALHVCLWSRRYEFDTRMSPQQMHARFTGVNARLSTESGRVRFSSRAQLASLAQLVEHSVEARGITVQVRGGALGKSDALFKLHGSVSSCYGTSVDGAHAALSFVHGQLHKVVQRAHAKQVARFQILRLHRNKSREGDVVIMVARLVCTQNVGVRFSPSPQRSAQEFESKYRHGDRESTCVSGSLSNRLVHGRGRLNHNGVVGAKPICASAVIVQWQDNALVMRKRWFDSF